MIIELKRIRGTKSCYRYYYSSQVDRGLGCNELIISIIGTASDPSNLEKKFRQSLRKTGLLGIRFHDLTHTSASLMLNNSIDIFVASKRLGHAKPSITLDVDGHLLSSAQNEVAERMFSLIKN